MSESLKVLEVFEFYFEKQALGSWLTLCASMTVVSNKSQVTIDTGI